jgi:hypothetical protein
MMRGYLGPIANHPFLNAIRGWVIGRAALRGNPFAASYALHEIADTMDNGPAAPVTPAPPVRSLGTIVATVALLVPLWAVYSMAADPSVIAPLVPDGTPVWLILWLFWPLPALVAFLRWHPQVAVIALANLFLGGDFAAWSALLVVAFA